MFISLMLGCENIPIHRSMVEVFVQQLGTEFQFIALDFFYGSASL